MLPTLELSLESSLELPSGSAQVLEEESSTEEMAVEGGGRRRRSETGTLSCVRVRVSSGVEIAICRSEREREGENPIFYVSGGYESGISAPILIFDAAVVLSFLCSIVYIQS